MMDDDRAEVWTLASLRVLLVQPAGLGVPAAAVVASDGTIGGTFYEGDAVATYATWQAATRAAETKRAELGVAWRIEYSDPRYDLDG